MKPAPSLSPVRRRGTGGTLAAHPRRTQLAEALRVVTASLALGAGAAAPLTALAQASKDPDRAPMQLRPGTQLRESLPDDVKRQVPNFVSGERMEGQTDGVTVLEGNAQLRRHDTVIQSDRIEYDRRTNDAKGTGNVRINRNGDRYEGPELQINLDTYKGQFREPVYRLLKNDAQGDAKRVDFLGKNQTQIHEGRYSTCERPPGSRWMPDWLVRATRIDLDNDEEIGTARSGVLEFMGVPILAAPYFSFPLSDKRKSGVLPPSVALDSQSGFQLSVPYYFNLAPQFDATLTPTLMSKRGLDLAGEFRYLGTSYDGQWRGAFMPSDRLRDINRWGYSVQHNQRLTAPLAGGGPLGLQVNLNEVSDDNYWRDFPRSVTNLTARLLPSDVAFGWNRGPLNVYAGAYTWQTLQDTSAPITAPYDRLPSVGLTFNQTGQQLLGSAGWDTLVQTEYTQFRRSSQANSAAIVASTVEGNRALMVAELTRRFQTPGWFVQPRAKLHATQYRYDLASGSRGSASRTVPSLSVDSGLIFERPLTLFSAGYTQTLEPRAYLTWTPFRNQSGLPNFDSGIRDFSFATMFTENEYNGNDRISDTRAVTLGLESRLIRDAGGAEAVRVGVAQRVRLKDRNVTLPGEVGTTDKLSDTLFSGRVQWDPEWSVESTLQYNFKSSESVRTTLGGRYAPGPYRVLNAAYRIQKGVSEQVDVGWQWPVSALFGPAPDPVYGRALGSGQWYSVGRLNYSLPERKFVDLVAGFEYDGGCWLGRVVVSRLQQSTTTANQSILFQLEFSGFSRLGSSSLQTLQATVPQYRYLRDEVISPSRFQRYD